jgi:hypothetical protein
LTEDLADRITALNSRLTAVPGPDGSLTIDAMSDDDVRSVADELVYITLDLTREMRALDA